MPFFRSVSTVALLSLVILLCALNLPSAFAQTPDYPKPTPEVQALLDQARPLRNMGKLSEAEPLYQQARDKALFLQDKAGEAMTMVGYATLLQRKNQLPESLKLFEQARALSREIGAKSVEAAAVGSIGIYFYTIGKPLLAAERWEEARKLYSLVGDRNSEAGMLMNLGVIYENTGQIPKAIPIYEQVLPIFRELKNTVGEATTLMNLGQTFKRIGKNVEAKIYLKQALTLFRELGDKSSEAQILGGLMDYASREGDLTEALKLGNEALAAARASRSPQREANALDNLAVLSRLMGQMTQALENSHRALALARASHDLRMEATILSNTAIVYSRMGEPQKAIELLHQAAQLHHSLNDPSGLLSVNINLGYLCCETSRFEQAEGYFRTALSLAKELNAPGLRASALGGLAWVASSRRDYPLALKLHQEALTLYRAQKDKNLEAGALGNMGVVFIDQKKYAAARTAQLKALVLYRQVSDKNGIANTLNSLGEIARVTKQSTNVQATYFRQALTAARLTGNRQYQANALRGLALAARARKDDVEAVKQGAAGIALLEEIRTALGGYTAAKAEYLSGYRLNYSEHLELLLDTGRAAEAFEFAQKLKARNLLDTLAYGRVALSSVLTEEERRKEQTLREKADSLNQRMVQEGVQNEVGAKKRFAALKAELKTTERELQTLTETLYGRHPELVRRRVAKTATLTDMAQLLPAETALLEYVSLNEKTLGLFVVTTQGGKAQVQAMKISAKAMSQHAKSFRLACSDPHKSWKAQSRALSQQLIAPASKFLHGKTRLIVCPDGALWDVPFGALFHGRQTLGSRYILSSAYSATGAQAAHSLAQQRKQRAGRILVVANPDFGSTKRFDNLNTLPGQRPLSDPARPLSEPARPLSEPARPLSDPARSLSLQIAATVPKRGGYIASLAGTQREADAIKALFPTAELLTRKHVQEETVKTEAGKFRYLHFATHGFVNDASPMLSSVVLAQPKAGSKEDGFLTAREVYELKLNAEMVTLSACNTGRGETRSGEGIIGLTWALLCAGCPTQVVSQWSVDDAATALLMGNFYSSLKAGQEKSAALRNATQSLQSNRKYRHPYYWAAFVLMGEGK